MWEHERLLVYQKAMDAAVEVDRIARSLPYHRRDLRTQVLRSSSSVVLNIAEGAGEFSYPEKARIYRIARRSAAECASTLDLIARLRLGEMDLLHAKGLLGEVGAMLTTIITRPPRGKGT